jgi:phenylacetate-CoA ligase
MAGTNFDPLERRHPEARRAALATALPDLVRHAVTHAPGWGRQLAGVEPAAVDGIEALASLPVLRKAELIARQADDPPFGGLAATPVGSLRRVFTSPGPIFEPEGNRPDFFRLARALFAAGFRKGDLVHNAFAYHLMPAGAMLESGAQALGCPVIPAGTGNTDQQVRVIEQLRPVGYVGTPSFLGILLDKAEEAGVRSNFAKALVSGEAFPRPLAERLRAEHGIDGYQAYAIADLGLIAYETEAHAGLVVDEGVIVEIVAPGSGDPVAEGEVGEVVVTTFNPDYPLIRFATGDLSAFLPGPSPCGRTNCRLRGWLGRADQSTKVRGLFVHPHQVGQIAGRHPEVTRARLVVGQEHGRDRLTLEVEASEHPEGLASELAATIRDVTGLRGEVRFTLQGTLPADGPVIDDQRGAD